MHFRERRLFILRLRERKTFSKNVVSEESTALKEILILRGKNWYFGVFLTFFTTQWLKNEYFRLIPSNANSKFEVENTSKQASRIELRKTNQKGQNFPGKHIQSHYWHKKIRLRRQLVKPFDQTFIKDALCTQRTAVVSRVSKDLNIRT